MKNLQKIMAVLVITALVAVTHIVTVDYWDSRVLWMILGGATPIVSAILLDLTETTNESTKKLSILVYILSFISILGHLWISVSA